MVNRLENVRVLVTRPKERSEELCFLLEDEGAQVLSLPLLELLPPEDARPLRSAAEHVHRYRWVLFTSPSAVQAFMEAARQAGTVERLSKVRVATVGPATSKSARAHGLEVAKEASESTGPGLFEAIRAELEPSDEVLLPAAQEGRRELEAALEEHGIRVTRVAAYRSQSLGVEEEALLALAQSPPDVVLFGSPRTAEAFLEAVGEGGRGLLLNAAVIALGPTTAGALGALGLPVSAVAERPTSAALVEAAVSAVQARRA